MTSQLDHKACIACGIEKPLSAYLEISGPKGTTYGTLCTDCRGSNADKKLIIESETIDTDSSGSAGLKIDTKTKTQAEITNKQQAQQQKDATAKERKGIEQLLEEKSERIDFKEQFEKKHSAERIEIKHKQQFLSQRQPQTPAQSPNGPTEAATTNEAAKTQQHTLTNTELTMTNFDPREARYQGEFLSRLKWMGINAPLAKAFEDRLSAKSAPVATKEKPGTSPEKDPLVESIENKWGPSSRR